MTDPRPRTPRTLLIPDHLWQAFETMAAEMGGEREALISQALYTFARLNGFLIPHDLQKLGSEQVQPAPRLAAVPAARPAPAVPSASFGGGSSGATLLEGISPAPRPPPRAAPSGERKAEIERALSNNPPPVASPRPPPAAPAMGGGVEVDDSLLGEDGIQATSMELPNLAAMGLMPGKAKSGAAAEEIVESGPPAEDDAGHVRTLVLSADGRELDRVVKERFLIGRGKHCDLIINSGKVSREHAVITREGNDFFIEDLGSSNGTWFDKRRIGKRQIQDGDEYYVCAEKLTCQLR